MKGERNMAQLRDTVIDGSLSVSSDLVIGSSNMNVEDEINIIKTNKVLWEGGWYMDDKKTANLNARISEQPNGIALVFNYYNNGITNQSWHSFFIPKYAITIGEGYAWDFWMGETKFGKVCGKALLIYDDYIKGTESNTASGTANGITYDNNSYVLRYVIGV